MRSARGVGCGLVVLGVCVAAAISLTAGSASATSSALTRKQVIALIHKYSKPGKTGATGPAGATGPTGPAGTAGTSGAGTSAPSYAAGAGLALSGNTFSVDPTQVQQRIGKSCAPYELIVGVAENGTPTCDFGALVDTNNVEPTSPIALNGIGTTVATLGVGFAAYFVTAEAALENTSGSSSNVHCAIDNGATVDATTFITIPANSFGNVSLQAWQDSGAGTDILQCSMTSGSGVVVLATSPKSATANIAAINVSRSSSLGH